MWHSGTAATYGLYRVATVNRESLDRVEGNQYSVPVGHGGQAVDVRLLREAVRISRDGQLLAEHPRLQGTGQHRREPAHYLPAWRTDPGRGWSWSASSCAPSAWR